MSSFVEDDLEALRTVKKAQLLEEAVLLERKKRDAAALLLEASGLVSHEDQGASFGPLTPARAGREEGSRSKLTPAAEASTSTPSWSPLSSVQPKQLEMLSGTKAATPSSSSRPAPHQATRSDAKGACATSTVAAHASKHPSEYPQGTVSYHVEKHGSEATSPFIGWAGRTVNKRGCLCWTRKVDLWRWWTLLRATLLVGPVLQR